MAIYLFGSILCLLYYLLHVKINDLSDIIVGLVIAAFSWIGLLALIVGQYLKAL